MKRIAAYSLDLELTKEVTSDVSEFDRLAGKEGAAHDSAVNNELYRGTFPEFRDGFLTWLEAATGIERKKDDEGNPTEQELKFARRVYETLARNGGTVGPVTETTGEGDNKVGIEVVPGFVVEAGTSPDKVKSMLSAAAQYFMDKAEFNPAKKERKTPEASGLKTAKKTYDSLIAAGKAVDKLAAFFTKKLGYEVAADEQAVVKAIAENTRREREAEKLRLAAEIDSE